MTTTEVAARSIPLGRRPAGAPVFSPHEITNLVRSPRTALDIVSRGAGLSPGVGVHGAWAPSSEFVVLGSLPALYPEWLGDRSFGVAHGVRFPYIAGEMANGIATPELVIAMARAEMLGFFGAGGLGLPAIEQALGVLTTSLGSLPNWGVNLIHSPGEPGHEDRVVDLLQRFGVRMVSASAFMDLSPAVVRCAVAGLRASGDGRVVRKTHLFAKVSRLEVAEKFMSPAPRQLLDQLVVRGQITEAEARLAALIPLASDVTVEADSGGHTDNRPLTVIVPEVLRLRAALARRFGYAERIRVGAAGGLGDPAGVAAAYACGADYVLTGTINQRAREAGISDAAKKLLVQADYADVTMAPSADMFELGVKVQVLRRGTMFASRAAALYEAYVNNDNLDAIPAPVREKLERTVLRASFAQAWAQTRAFWVQRDADQVRRAEVDPKHRMALVFRSYLGQSSRWAIAGDPDRQADFQIWCGPAIGAFNRWIAGSPLDQPDNCTAVQIARNLLEGAAVVTRAHQLRTFGVPVEHTDLYLPQLCY